MKISENLSFQNFEQKFENQVVDLWNRCLYFDSISIDKFRRQALYDDNFDVKKCFVCLDDSEQVAGLSGATQPRVVGFILATKRKFPYLERGLEPQKAWINILFVDKEYRRQGIGTELLRLAEDAVTDGDTKQIIVGAYSPNYFLYGIDVDHYDDGAAFFASRGYDALEEHYTMGQDLFGYNLDDELLAKKADAESRGYKFQMFSEDKSLELLDFLSREFGAGWKRNALTHLNNGCAEEMIMLALDPQGRICGMCNRAIDGNPSRIGPFGVAESERNAGLGTVIFRLQMYNMAKHGIYHVWFATTEKNARRLYERLGFKVYRLLVNYTKELA